MVFYGQRDDTSIKYVKECNPDILHKPTAARPKCGREAKMSALSKVGMSVVAHLVLGLEPADPMGVVR
jgi:hypothetical protein